MAADFVRLNGAALARVQRRWADLLSAPMVPTQDEALAQQLELFGLGSLLHLFGDAMSAEGARLLANWLTHPCDGPTLAEMADGSAGPCTLGRDRL